MDFPAPVEMVFILRITMNYWMHEANLCFLFPTTLSFP